MVFLVRRQGDVSTAGTVDYAIDSTSTATKGTGAANDYTGNASGTLRFDAGESIKEIRLTVNGDYFKEVNEKLVVNLSNLTGGGNIIDATGIGTITEIDLSRTQGAFDLTDINPELTTFAIRVRRSSDNAEKDIGFDANGKLDINALLAFVGSNSGYVSIWYDQSSRQANLTQTDNTLQGVIINNGDLITDSDGNPTISFNEFNGQINGNMSMSGTGDNTTAVSNVEVYARYQYDTVVDGVLFQLGFIEGPGRRRMPISAHAPWGDHSTYFDAGNASIDSGRLMAITAQTANVAQDLVFMANSNSGSSGTTPLNGTDAAQAFFVSGVVAASDNTLGSLITGDIWYMMKDPVSPGNHEVGQSGRINRFIVSAGNNGPLSSPGIFNGSTSDDVFTYSGEANRTGFSGFSGYDTIYVSGGNNFDVMSLTSGLNSIDHIFMANGAANMVTISDAIINANATVLTIQLDAGDRISWGTNSLNYSENVLESVVIGTSGADAVTSSFASDNLFGREGADVFTWLSSQTGTDTIKDFSTAQGDKLDISLLLNGYTAGNESDYLNFSIVSGNTEIAIDHDGLGSGTARQKIIIEDNSWNSYDDASTYLTLLEVI